MTEADIWFSYQGRISVGQYWGRFLLGVIAVFVLAFLIYSSVRLNAADGVLGLVSILAIWPSTALAWKRLQDQDRHGALFLLVLIPLIGAIVWLVFSLQSGTPGPNKHGPKTGYRY